MEQPQLIMGILIATAITKLITILKIFSTMGAVVISLNCDKS